MRWCRRPPRCTVSATAGIASSARELLAKAGVQPTQGTQAQARTEGYYHKRPCPELCRMCADLCAEFIAAHPEGRHMDWKE